MRQPHASSSPSQLFLISLPLHSLFSFPSLSAAVLSLFSHFNLVAFREIAHGVFPHFASLSSNTFSVEFIPSSSVRPPAVSFRTTLSCQLMSGLPRYLFVKRYRVNLNLTSRGIFSSNVIASTHVRPLAVSFRRTLSRQLKSDLARYLFS
jgi:hypothetical protein